MYLFGNIPNIDDFMSKGKSCNNIKGKLYAFIISLLFTIVCFVFQYYLAAIGGILVTVYFLTEMMHIDFPDDERNY